MVRTPTQIIALPSWAQNLLTSCRNLGLWLSELCSEVLNPEMVSVTDLAWSHYLKVKCLAIYIPPLTGKP